MNYLYQIKANIRSALTIRKVAILRASSGCLEANANNHRELGSTQLKIAHVQSQSDNESTPALEPTNSVVYGFYACFRVSTRNATLDSVKTHAAATTNYLTPSETYILTSSNFSINHFPTLGLSVVWPGTATRMYSTTVMLALINGLERRAPETTVEKNAIQEVRPAVSL